MRIYHVHHGEPIYSPDSITYLGEQQAYSIGKKSAQIGDEFMFSLGYEHEKRTGRYKIVAPSKQKVAFFAHALFGNAFLSCLLDIQYPFMVAHFGHCLTGLTVIDFEERDGYAYPKVLTFSNDGHLEKDGVIAGPNGKSRNY